MSQFSSNETTDSDESSVDLMQYLYLFWRWAWLIALVGLVAGGAAYMLSKRTMPIYKAATTLLINEAPSNTTTDYSTIMTSEQMAQTYAQMITKRPVMEEVVKRLGASLKPEQLSGAVSVSPVRDTQLMIISVEDTDPQFTANTANMIATVFAEQVMQNQAERFSSSIESLQNQMHEVDNQINQTHIEIAAAKAAEEANIAEINKLEANLNQYRINELEVQISETSKSLLAVKIEEDKNQNEIARLEKLLTHYPWNQPGMQNKQTTEALDLARSARIEKLNEIDHLESRLSQYEQIYANLLVNYGELRTSEQQSSQGKINLIPTPINTNIDNQISETNSALSKAKASRDKNLSEIEHLETRLSQSEQLYSNLSVSYEQARLTEKQSISSITQVESASVPRSPISPNTMQNTMVGVMVGIMLAVGGIFVYDLLDDTIKNPEDITRHFKLPLLGVISRYEQIEDGDDESDLITRTDPRSPVAESFRSLRTNVQYSSVERPLRTLLLTSPAPSDGKTTITANLAVVLAQSGRRVAVVDADLHRPQVHAVFHAEIQPGLTSLFIQPDLHMNGTVQSTAQEGLRVVCAGKLPPNPSELLGSNKMREIIDTLLTDADIVILDTPPVLSVTDAVVLAPVVDAVILVVKPNDTRMSMLKAAVEQLRRVNANLIGVVLNDVDVKHAGYGYYYKNYDYKTYDYNRAGHQPVAQKNPSTK